MSTAVPRNVRRRLRWLPMIVLLAIAATGLAVPARAKPSLQQPDPPVRAQQVGGLTYVPIVQDVPGGKPNATAWLSLSAPTINPGSFFALTVLAKSTGTTPEPFINVFVTYNTGLIDFQSANPSPGDFVRTSTDGFSVQFAGPLAPGEENYATVVFRARAGVTNADVRFAGSFEAANNTSGGLPKVTLQIGSGGLRPSVRYACEFGRGGSGPLGQNPASGNYPFGTRFTFGAFRRDNGGCGFTFAPNARVSFWVAQPTGPSVPTNIYANADTYGEVEIRYTTFQLQNACPVNLCAFAMNGSSDNSYVLVAPFNLTRPPLSGSEQSVPPSVAAPASVADESPINTAQTGTGALEGTVTGSDGSALEGITVFANPQFIPNAPFLSTQTDATGHYFIGGLASGSYEISFLPPAGSKWTLQETQVTITDSLTTTLNATLLPGGTISGRLTADSGAPLREVPVWIYDATQSQVVSVALTDANGNYTSGALPSGDYVVQFNPDSSDYDPSTGYTGEYQNDQPLGAPPTPVTVTAPAATGNVNGTLARCATCGAVQGRVTTSDGGQPLGDVTVIVRNAANGQQVAIDTTDEDGVYHLLVPTGSYSVEFFTDVSPLSQVRAYLDGYAAPATIQVTAPAVVGNINSVLSRGGQIAGLVTAADGGTGLADVVVAVTNASGQPVTTTITDADGSYTTPALANGSYTLQFQTDQSPTEATRPYAPATRTVTVSGPGAKAGTNVTLSR